MKLQLIDWLIVAVFVLSSVALIFVVNKLWNNRSETQNEN